MVVEESSLIITTTDAFENYEANAESGSGEHVLTAIIYLKCETSELSMLVRLQCAFQFQFLRIF